MKKIIFISLIFLGFLSCSEESSPNTDAEEDAVFVDQGTSIYADNDPLNDVLLQGFWWDSYNDTKISNYNSLYAFLEDQIVALSNAHIDGIWMPPSSEGREWATIPGSYLILILSMEIKMN